MQKNLLKELKLKDILANRVLYSKVNQGANRECFFYIYQLLERRLVIKNIKFSFLNEIQTS